MILPMQRETSLSEAARAKAQGLQRMLEAGLPVPPGWAILPGVSSEALLQFASELPSEGLRSLAVRSSSAERAGCARLGFLWHGNRKSSNIFLAVAGARIGPGGGNRY